MRPERFGWQPWAGAWLGSTMQPAAQMPVPPPRAHKGRTAWRRFGARWAGRPRRRKMVFCGESSHGAARAKRGLPAGWCTVGPPLSGIQSKDPRRKALMWPNLVGFRAGDCQGRWPGPKPRFSVGWKGLKVSFPPHAAIRHVVHHRRGAPNRTNENKYYLR